MDFAVAVRPDRGSVCSLSSSEGKPTVVFAQCLPLTSGTAAAARIVAIRPEIRIASEPPIGEGGNLDIAAIEHGRRHAFHAMDVAGYFPLVVCSKNRRCRAEQERDGSSGFDRGRHGPSPVVRRCQGDRTMWLLIPHDRVTQPAHAFVKRCDYQRSLRLLAENRPVAIAQKRVA
jgi:hypothetical protein